MSGTSKSQLPESISDQIMEMLTSKISEKELYYQKYPTQIPSVEMIPVIIQGASRDCSLIAGGASIIPGLIGVITAVPVIAKVFQIQVGMICDIYAAYLGHRSGKKFYIPSGLILAMLGHDCGAVASGYLAKWVANRGVEAMSEEVAKKIVVALLGKVVEQGAKTVLSGLIPMIGSVAVGGMAFIQTRQMGNMTNDMFSKERTKLDQLQPTQEKPRFSSAQKLQLEKAKLMINLMQIDGEVNQKEKDVFLSLINPKELSFVLENMTTYLEKSSGELSVDFNVISEKFDETLQTVSDLIQLGRIDGKKAEEPLNLMERLYIKHVGTKLGLSYEDIQELFKSNPLKSDSNLAVAHDCEKQADDIDLQEGKQEALVFTQ
ncbi:MAG: hypothetical protein HQM10_25615 [Candidatus Riflebacteria bacterium]|nr:hypothetical protein [Candidatus Riflebacteria bacterium]